MIGWFIRRQLAAFECAYDYDASYLRDMLAVSPRVTRRFARVAALAHAREDVPPAVWHAAVITTVRAEDCGPCVQLAVTMAARDGVDTARLAALLRDDIDGMGDDMALGWRYARAVLAHDVDADTLRDRIAQQWSPRAVVSLALAVALAGVFPRLKYGLGHGKTCTHVTVGGEAIAPASVSIRMTA
jgi:alkylhydroperoxidase family enzyme